MGVWVKAKLSWILQVSLDSTGSQGQLGGIEVKRGNSTPVTTLVSPREKYKMGTS